MFHKLNQFVKVNAKRFALHEKVNQENDASYNIVWDWYLFTYLHILFGGLWLSEGLWEYIQV